MKDPRYTKLANVLVKHSTQVKPGEKVLIEAYDIPPDFTAELIRVVAAALQDEAGLEFSLPLPCILGEGGGLHGGGWGRANLRRRGGSRAERRLLAGCSPAHSAA